LCRLCHLVAAGRDRAVPVVAPTQYLLESDTVRLRLVARNPMLAAIAEEPRVLLSVAGDWAYVPSAWNAIGDEDPLLGIPITYYAAVQLIGVASVVDDPVRLRTMVTECAARLLSTRCRRD